MSCVPNSQTGIFGSILHQRQTMSVRYRSSLLLFTVFGLLRVSNAQQFQHIQAYREADFPGSKFGWSIATTNDHVVVGLPHAVGQDGAAFIYPMDDLAWSTVSGANVMEGNATPPVDQRFGAVVAAHGEFAAVASCSPYGTDQYCNSAAQWVSIYRFAGGSWQYTQSIPAPIGTSGNFGKALALSADHLAVGGSRIAVDGVVQDVVFLFGTEGDQWSSIPMDTLVSLSTTGSGNGSFGHALTLRSDRLLVGASGDDELGVDCGAAYMFSKDQGGEDNWGLVRKLLPSNGDPGDRFGFSVAMIEERCVVGAPLRAFGGEEVGAAYVFERNAGASDNWGEVKAMSPSEPRPNMQYGASVAMNVDRIAVGAPLDVFSENGTDGSVEVFLPQGDTWNFAQRIVPYWDGHVSQVSRSGTSLAFARDKLLIGAPFAIVDNSTNTPTGALLVYGDPELGLGDEHIAEVGCFPNPARDRFTIQGMDVLAPSGCSIDLLDLTGRVVLRKVLQRPSGLESISCMDAAEGTYLIRIQDRTGLLRIVPVQLVIQR